MCMHNMPCYMLHAFKKYPYYINTGIYIQGVSSFSSLTPLHLHKTPESLRINNQHVQYILINFYKYAPTIHVYQ